jgi:hypothetical protein
MSGSAVGTFTYSISNGEMAISGVTGIFGAITNYGPFVKEINNNGSGNGAPTISGVTVSPSLKAPEKGKRGQDYPQVSCL